MRGPTADQSDFSKANVGRSWKAKFVARWPPQHGASMMMNEEEVSPATIQIYSVIQDAEGR